MPEARKLRPGEANEESKLSDFQVELVQLGAALNGEHKKDIFPHKLVENMTVGDGAKYVKEAFQTFLQACEEETISNIGHGGEHEIVSVGTPKLDPKKKPKKSFANRVLGCIVCNSS